MYERICYEHGNVKTGKKLLEIHKTCDCVREQVWQKKSKCCNSYNGSR